LSKFAVFILAGEEFGLELSRIVEILKAQKITPLPKLPSFLCGVINLRGIVIPIMDLRKRFGMAPSPIRERIIIVKTRNERIGLLVDAVKGILSLEKENVIVPPSIFKGLKAEYLSGIGKAGDRLIVLLSLDNLLTSEERIDLGELKSEIRSEHEGSVA